VNYSQLRREHNKDNNC